MPSGFNSLVPAASSSLARCTERLRAGCWNLPPPLFHASPHQIKIFATLLVHQQSSLRIRRFQTIDRNQSSRYKTGKRNTIVKGKAALQCIKSNSEETSSDQEMETVTAPRRENTEIAIIISTRESQKKKVRQSTQHSATAMGATWPY